MKLFCILTLQFLLVGQLTCADTFVAKENAGMSLDALEKVEQTYLNKDPCDSILFGFCLGIPVSFDAIILSNSTSSVVSETILQDLKALKSRPTINEAALLSNKGVQFPKNESLSGVFKSKNALISDLQAGDKAHQNLMDNVVDAITRTLNFYGSHLVEVGNVDTAIALVMLKGIDTKHDGALQKTFPLGQWLQDICEQSGRKCSAEGKFCKSFVHQWDKKSGTEVNGLFWKSENILEAYLNKTEAMAIKAVGDEKEELWSVLNGQCQFALYTRCEVPYVCERTLLDPNPKSQYLLTHQLFYRMMIDHADCPSNPTIKSFATDEKTYNDLCGKVLLETKYLDALDVPEIYRDLFSEMIGFCGYMGYPNFLREDWLNRILSRQSKSDFGCFVRNSQFTPDYFSTDIGFVRKATKRELEYHIQPNEKCLPHFTLTSLMALSTYYDYLMDSQKK